MFYVECNDCDANAETDDGFWMVDHHCPEES